MDNSTGEQVAPIIIKRKKVVKAAEHHGGAWKVAYADFVTAMMAFFLLMWLLNATTEEQRKGLADYFNPTIPISRISGGGSDGLNGSSIFTEETFANMGTGATRRASVARPQSAETAAEIAENLEAMKAGLADDGQQLSEHLLVKLSPEGVVLELVDTDDEPLFSVGRQDPTPLLLHLLKAVSDTFDAFEEDIKIVGHTDSLRYRNGATFDNWDLSAGRANTARRLLIETGMDVRRIVEVAGRADTDLLSLDEPLAAQNRRISIIIIT